MTLIDKGVFSECLHVQRMIHTQYNAMVRPYCPHSKLALSLPRNCGCNVTCPSVIDIELIYQRDTPQV